MGLSGVLVSAALIGKYLRLAGTTSHRYQAVVEGEPGMNCGGVVGGRYELYQSRSVYLGKKIDHAFFSTHPYLDPASTL